MAKIEKYTKVIFDNGKNMYSKYAESICNSEKIIRISTNGKQWAVVNSETGEVVSNYKYIVIWIAKSWEEYDNDFETKIFFAIDVKGKLGALNEKGKEIIPCEYNYSSNIRHNRLLFHKSIGGKVYKVILNYNNEKIIPLASEIIPLKKGGYIVQKDGLYGIFEENGEIKHPFEYDEIVWMNEDDNEDAILLL